MRGRLQKKLAKRLKVVHTDPFGFNSQFDESADKDGRRFTHQQHVEIKKANRRVAAMQSEAFRSACIDVLGEDPDDWGLTWEEYDAKYAAAQEHSEGGK